jgi:hypothetical protein
MHGYDVPPPDPLVLLSAFAGERSPQPVRLASRLHPAPPAAKPPNYHNDARRRPTPTVRLFRDGSRGRGRWATAAILIIGVAAAYWRLPATPGFTTQVAAAPVPAAPPPLRARDTSRASSPIAMPDWAQVLVSEQLPTIKAAPLVQAGTAARVLAPVVKPVAAVPSEKSETTDSPDAPAASPPSPPGLAAAEPPIVAAAVAPAARQIVPAPVSAEEGIRQALYSYRNAYESLNASAAASVWPSVDRRALTRAFAALKSQGLEFTRCAVTMGDVLATVSCRGTLQVVPRSGNPSPVTADQEWVFKMRRVGVDWKIDDVSSTQPTPRAGGQD